MHGVTGEKMLGLGSHNRQMIRMDGRAAKSTSIWPLLSMLSKSMALGGKRERHKKLEV